MSSSVVLGGKSIPLDFDERDSYTVAMFKSDRIFFEYDNDVHSIILDEVLSTRVEFDIFIYQNTKFNKENPNYAFLDTVHTLRLDMERDNIHDFEIKLNDFDTDRGSAIVEFSKISIPKIGDDIDLDDEDIKEDIDDNGEVFYRSTGFFTVIGVIIVLIIIISLIDSVIKRRKETYY
tara:strand:+ start:2409 stop:2939 length:531 start_codon:yes stop_codon:yes gene_type:complete